MFSRNYHYLIAGLPDIIIDQTKLAVSVEDFRQELQLHLHPDDYRLLETLFLPADNRNVLNMLLKNGKKFINSGRYSIDELEEEIKEPKDVPEYLITFISHFKSSQPVYAELSWEDQLTALYYEHASKSGNDFLRSWLEFERDVRNILTALTARRHKIPAENLLIGDNPVTQGIRRSHARDFGLSGGFPFIDKLLQINENSKLLEREKAIDQLKWTCIDEFNTFNYFTVEVILGFVLKLGMVERWMKLDKKSGEEMFRRLLTDLENSYEFTKEFSF